jgi:hypothetical protein
MRDRRRAAAFFFFFRRRKIEDAYVFFYSEKTCAANLCYVVLVRPFSKVMRTSQLVSNLALDSYPTTSRTSANGDHARSFRSARVRVQLRDLAYSSCEDPLTRPLGRGGTSREIRDVTCGWCASGRPLVCSRVGDRIETGRPGAKFKKCERDGAASSVRRGFLLGGENKMTAAGTHRPDARARASTGWDTPSSGGASVPSRIRPESTVREITQPVSLALSSSTPSDANDRVGSRVSAMRARARPGRSEPDRARVAKHAERRARVLPLDVLRCAHLLARAVRSMRRARSRRPPSAVLDCFAVRFRPVQLCRAIFPCVSFFIRSSR